MLTIAEEIRDEIVAHARRDHPDEACGIVAGPEGSHRPLRTVAMTNAERSPTFFRFDSSEQLRVWRELDDLDEVPVVIYHSHTATEAYPSRTDIGSGERAGRALRARLDGPVRKRGGSGGISVVPHC